MMDLEFIKWLVQDIGGLLVVIILGAMVANRALVYLSKQAEADEVRQKSWDDIRKQDNDAWLALMSGQRVAMETLNQTIRDERTVTMAYQNTTSTALAKLLAIVQDLQGVPMGIKKAQDTLDVINKKQVGISEAESKHDLEMRQQLAKTNNALVEMQKEVKRMAVAMEKLPATMQATIAPLVGMMEMVLSTAQATQSKLDDMPLMPVGDNHHADLMTDKTHYASSNGDAPHPAIEVITPSSNDVNNATGGE
jgi:hypothetical protein